MENKVEKGKTDIVAHLAFVVAFLVFVGCLGWTIYDKQYNHLFGEKILFKADYKTAQGLKAISEDRMMYSECISEETNVKITKDTVILVTSKGSVGFKPLSTRDLMSIPCKREDGSEVIIERIKTNGRQGYTTDEILVVSQPEMTIVLTKEEECLPLGRN